jgi:hypothetical protein
VRREKKRKSNKNHQHPCSCRRGKQEPGWSDVRYIELQELHLVRPNFFCCCRFYVLPGHRTVWKLCFLRANAGCPGIKVFGFLILLTILPYQVWRVYTVYSTHGGLAIITIGLGLVFAMVRIISSMLQYSPKMRDIRITRLCDFSFCSLLSPCSCFGLSVAPRW